MDELSKLYKAAREARANEKFYTAAKRYDQIRTEDPTDWEAQFYFQSCAARCHNSFVHIYAARNIGDAAENLAFHLESVMDRVYSGTHQEKHTEIYREIAGECLSTGVYLFEEIEKATVEPEAADNSLADKPIL